jgi:hypothetical protein
MLHNLVKEFKESFEETLVSSAVKTEILHEFTHDIKNIFDKINMNLYLSQEVLKQESELFKKLKELFIKYWTYYNFFSSNAGLGIYIYPFEILLSGSDEVKSLTVNTEKKVKITYKSNAVLVNIKSELTDETLNTFILYPSNDFIVLYEILSKISKLNPKSNNFMVRYKNHLNTDDDDVVTDDVVVQYTRGSWGSLQERLNEISLGEKEKGKYKPLDIYLIHSI